MVISAVSKRFKCFIYDFTVDGGAVSSIPTGLFITAGSVVTSLFYKCLTTGIGGTYAVGWAGTTGALIAPTAAATIVAGTTITTGLVPTFTAPVVVAVTQELLFTIAGAPITQGKAAFCFEWTEMQV